MGIKCPRCKSSNTEAYKPNVMLCKNCSYSWKPKSSVGKKMEIVGDGILTPVRKVLKGAKTEARGGDGSIYPPSRVPKGKYDDDIFGVEEWAENFEKSLKKYHFR